MTFDVDTSQRTQSVTTFDTKIELFVCTMKRCVRCQSMVTCKDQYPQDVITSTVMVWRNENDAINLYRSCSKFQNYTDVSRIYCSFVWL